MYSRNRKAGSQAGSLVTLNKKQMPTTFFKSNISSKEARAGAILGCLHAHARRRASHPYLNFESISHPSRYILNPHITLLYISPTIHVVEAGGGRICF